MRRLHFVQGSSICQIHWRTGLHATRSAGAISSDEPPRSQRAPSGSTPDPFENEIHRLLGRDPRLPGQRIRGLIAPFGFVGGKTIVDDYLNEIPPVFLPPPH